MVGGKSQGIAVIYVLIFSVGKYFKLSARHQLHPSPQRTPVIFQAGTSKAGQAFAARHAEAIYIGGMVPSHAAGQIKVSLLLFDSLA